MKMLIISITLIFVFFAFSSYIFADSPGKLSINGYIETNNLLRLKNGNIDSNLNTLGLKFEGSTDRYHYFSELAFSYYGKSNFSTNNDNLGELANLQSVTPIELNLKEGYLDLYSFLFPFLDVRVGKQIIVWGTADKVNPTGNICPSDMSNLLDFGNKLGINAFLLNSYIGNASLSTIYIPSFTPSLLPSDFLALSGIATEGTYTVDLPSQKLGITSQAAVKFEIPISTFDLSVSYYYGRYSIPNAYKVEINPTTQDVTSTYMFFPKVQVIGADFSGSLFDLGVWGEAGYFIPEKYNLSTYANGNPILISSDKTVDDPYLRYVLGCDYTFKNGIYINTQFIHGFDAEITKDNLNDYMICRVEKSFFNDKLKISPLTLFITTGDWDNIKNNFGVGYIPEIYYYPVDNIEIDFGCYILEGEGNNMVSNMKDKDMLFLKAKVSF